MKNKLTFEWRKLSQILIWLGLLGLFLYSGYKLFTLLDLGKRVWGYDCQVDYGCGCACSPCPSCPSCQPCPPRPTRMPSPTPTLVTPTPTVLTPTPTEPEATPTLTPTPVTATPTPTLLTPTPTVPVETTPTATPTLTPTPLPTATPTPAESGENGGGDGNGGTISEPAASAQAAEATGQILGAVALAATGAEQAPLAFLTSWQAGRSGQGPVRLAISSVAIDLPVFSQTLVDGVWTVPENGVGYLQGSGRLTDLSGNVVLFGHHRPGLLAALDQAKAGETIRLTDESGVEFVYQITGVLVVSPQTVAILAPTRTATLTIFTCSGWQEQQRLVVRAQLQPVRN